MKNLNKRNYLAKSTAFVLDELITTGFRIWYFSADLDEFLENYSDNIDEQKVTSLRTKVADQIEKRDGLVAGLNTRFPDSDFGTNVVEIIRIELMEFTPEGQLEIVDKINEHFNQQVGNRFLELIRVSYSCWNSQDGIEVRKPISEDTEKRLRSAVTAQQKNSDRSSLMIEIDDLLGESYRTVATKTYTYFEEKED